LTEAFLYFTALVIRYAARAAQKNNTIAIEIEDEHGGRQRLGGQGLNSLPQENEEIDGESKEEEVVTRNLDEEASANFKRRPWESSKLASKNKGTMSGPQAQTTNALNTDYETSDEEGGPRG